MINFLMKLSGFVLALYAAFIAYAQYETVKRNNDTGNKLVLSIFFIMIFWILTVIYFYIK